MLWLKVSKATLNGSESTGGTTIPVMQHSKMLLQYISMLYNSHRLHSYLGYKSPNQYETETEILRKVA
jgi:transposase InsO family protein